MTSSVTGFQSGGRKANLAVNVKCTRLKKNKCKTTIPDCHLCARLACGNICLCPVAVWRSGADALKSQLGFLETWVHFALGRVGVTAINGPCNCHQNRGLLTRGAREQSISFDKDSNVTEARRLLKQIVEREEKRYMIAICVRRLHMGIFTIRDKWISDKRPNLQVAARILAHGDVDSFYMLIKPVS